MNADETATSETWALLDDVCPSRASVYAVGTYDECRSKLDRSLTMARVRCETPSVGERIWHRIDAWTGERIVTQRAVQAYSDEDRAIMRTRGNSDRWSAPSD